MNLISPLFYESILYHISRNLTTVKKPDNNDSDIWTLKQLVNTENELPSSSSSPSIHLRLVPDGFTVHRPIHYIKQVRKRRTISLFNHGIPANSVETILYHKQKKYKYIEPE